MGQHVSPRASDGLAKLRSITTRERSAQQAPGPAPEPEPPPPTRNAPTVEGFPVEARGGKRKVLYLHEDVIEWLEQLQRAAESEGWRLTQSGIVEQLVRRHREES